MQSQERQLHPQLQNLFSDVKPDEQRPPRPNHDTGSMVVAAFVALTISVLIGVIVSTIIIKWLFGK